MNSYTFMGLDDVEEGEEISSRRKSFIKRAIAYIKTRRQATQVSRNSIIRDRAGAHERLVAAYFTDSPVYNEKPVMEIYGPEFLRKPTVTDVEKLYRYHEEKHGFPGMLGSLDSVASHDLWIGHAFFGVAGSNNDINILYQSPIFNDLKTGRAPEIPFVANGVTYPSGYYLVDGIYPELAPLVKTIPEPSNDDHKRILFKQKQESARKDVERAFGVLKKKWAILANPARALRKDRIAPHGKTFLVLKRYLLARFAASLLCNDPRIDANPVAFRIQCNVNDRAEIEHSSILGKGDDLRLVLDQTSGSGMQSKRGNSAGTVTAYYGIENPSYICSIAVKSAVVLTLGSPLSHWADFPGPTASSL
ncbi:ALP1-like protein isoform X1 [Tanacetum coccineum]